MHFIKKPRNKRKVLILSYFTTDNIAKCFQLNRFILEIEYKIIKLIDKKTPFDDILNKFKHQ